MQETLHNQLGSTLNAPSGVMLATILITFCASNSTPSLTDKLVSESTGPGQLPLTRADYQSLHGLFADL